MIRLVITSHAERRSLFESFSRHRKEEERKEKKAKAKQQHEAFRELLEEHAEKFNAEFTFSAFQKLVESDSRWAEVEEKDRETLFNEKIAPFKKEIEDSKFLPLFPSLSFLCSYSLFISLTFPLLAVC